MNTQRRTIIIAGQFFVPGSLFLVKNEDKERITIQRRTKNKERRTGGLLAAFTLVELLVVISIIALLLGIIVPSYFSIQKKAKVTKAKVAVKNLETAFKAYLDNYRTWPAGITWPTESDAEGMEIKGDLFRMLRGEDQPPGANPDHLSFYEFESTNSDAGALDPWSDPNDTTKGTWECYRVKVDRDYDNKIQGIYRSVLVWSDGPDRTNGTSDDVKSWD